MTQLPIVASSTGFEPERRHPSIADKIRAMGEARIGAMLLVIATVIAIIWANVSYPSYHDFWETHLTIGVGDIQLDFTLHAIVNDALMAIFFFTVGLEVRREFAIGELTSWSRAAVPVLAAIAGLVVPAALFLLIANGTGDEHAWGVVISTDTAFIVGALALVGPRVSGRLRVFLLALAVVDDIGALSIIALFYTADFTPMPLIFAAVGLAGIYFTRYMRKGRGLMYATLAIIVWLAFLASGVHPTLAGVAIALLVPVYRPNRRDVEQALELARTFRQSPNSEYARLAANSLRESISITERLTSAGRPVRHAEMRIVDPTTLRDVPVGASGEIWFRTPQATIGYIGRPDDTAALITDDDWVRTGDLGRVDDGGFLFIEDRLKDMIITGGENVYSPEVERVLAEHPSVAEIAIIGIPDDRWGETVKAVVAFRPGLSATSDELIAFARQRLAGYKVPTSIDVVEALPRNPSGKVLKRDLRKPYWGDGARQV
jgi:Na+/H+ antiporter NhaA